MINAPYVKFGAVAADYRCGVRGRNPRFCQRQRCAVESVFLNDTPASTKNLAVNSGTTRKGGFDKASIWIQ